MSKKKHAEHVNHERWLVSYADLLTLLFAFFVVLFASSVSDKKKSAAMAQAMQSAFTQSGIFDAHAKTPPLEPGAGNSQGKPTPVMTPLPTVPTAAQMAEVKQQVERVAAKAGVAGAVSVHSSSDGVTISLHEAGFFASGSADLNPTALPVLRSIAATLPERDLRIEGHTDNLPMHSERYPTNWELSTARAAAIANVLLTASHIAPSHFALAGYGPFRPVADNATADGRAKNRRVDIVLLGGTSMAASPVEPLAIVPVTPAAHSNADAARRTLAEQLAPDADRAAAH